MLAVRPSPSLRLRCRPQCSAANLNVGFRCVCLLVAIQGILRAVKPLEIEPARGDQGEDRLLLCRVSIGQSLIFFRSAIEVLLVLEQPRHFEPGGRRQLIPTSVGVSLESLPGGRTVFRIRKPGKPRPSVAEAAGERLESRPGPLRHPPRHCSGAGEIHLQ